MNDAAGDSRKQTADETSSVVPSLPQGCKEIFGKLVVSIYCFKIVYISFKAIVLYITGLVLC